MPRRIMHIDMDAFFASVEIRDNPHLAKKPVVVGGNPDKRGVVSAANYIARKYGVRSGQATRIAKQKCSHAIFLHPHFEKYKEASDTVKHILKQVTPVIESLSLDEAWLDISDLVSTDQEAHRLGLSIKKEIYRQTQLTCSIGIASSKSLAKIATEENKPDGIYMITEEHQHNFLMDLDLNRIPGVGKVFQQRLMSRGLLKGRDIYEKDLYELASEFGKMGGFLYQRIQGKDDRPVKSSRAAKSIGIERTFSEDVSDVEKLSDFYQSLFQSLWDRSMKKNRRSQTLQFKIKLRNFRVFTRRCQIPRSLEKYEDYLSFSQHVFLSILKQEFHDHEIRLIGISFIDLKQKSSENQLSLF